MNSTGKYNQNYFLKLSIWSDQILKGICYIAFENIYIFSRILISSCTEACISWSVFEMKALMKKIWMNIFFYLLLPRERLHGNWKNTMYIIHWQFTEN